MIFSIRSPRGIARILGSFVVAFALLAGLGACKRNQAPAAPAHRIVLGVSALRISLPVFVAVRDGLFRAHGLDVDVRTYPTAQPMMDDVALGHIDAGGYVAYPIAFLASARSSRPTQLVTTLVEDHEHRLSYVLAPTGSGLHFPADAAGKRIGILPTVAYRRWLMALLAAAHIDASSVTIVPVAPPLEAQMLRDHGIDMLFTNDPMATAILSTNVGEIIDDGPPCSQRLGDPFAFGTFAMSGAFAEQFPDLARRLVEALDEAVTRVQADPASARQAMVPFIRPEEQAFVDRYPPSRYLGAAQSGQAALVAEIARERQLGIIDSDPHVIAWQSPGTGR